MQSMKVFPSFLVDESNPAYCAIYSYDGTCLYVRLRAGAEVFNSTEYRSEELARAQRACALHVGLTTLGTIYVDNAPAGIDAPGLALLGLAAQIVGVLTDTAKVVDASVALAVK